MKTGKRHDNHSAKATQPEQLIAFLQYALPDVRAISERGARYLEDAVAALAEDSCTIAQSQERSNNRRLS